MFNIYKNELGILWVRSSVYPTGIQIRNYDMRNIGILQYISLPYFGKFTCNFGNKMC